MLFVKAFEKKYGLGIDFSGEYAQISFGTKKEEVKTYAMTESREEMLDTEDEVYESGIYDIPLKVFKKNGVSKWYFGDDADELSRTSSGVVISNILNCAMDGVPVVAEGKKYKPVDVFALFFKYCFLHLKMLFISFLPYLLSPSIGNPL